MNMLPPNGLQVEDDDTVPKDIHEYSTQLSLLGMFAQLSKYTLLKVTLICLRTLQLEKKCK